LGILCAAEKSSTKDLVKQWLQGRNAGSNDNRITLNAGPNSNVSRIIYQSMSAGVRIIAL
jgi:hypothetical protein